jgi:hypothetical protein
MRSFTLWAGIVALVALGAAAAASAKKAGPKIVLDPTSAMINTTVEVHGKGFAPNASITVAECSKTTWSLPEQPCVDGNQVTLTTNANGKFKTTMKVGLCPSGPTPVVSTGTPVTQRTCYIGQLTPTGIDTLALVGAAPLMVSWP